MRQATAPPAGWPAPVDDPDTLSRDDLLHLQGDRLRLMARYVHERSAFWKAKMDAVGVAPADVDSVDDIRALPVSERRELERDQAACPPAGSYACTNPRRWVRVFATSGTSGRHLRRVLSAADWEAFVGRSARDAALKPDDTVMFLSATDGLFGPSVNLEVAVRAGATVLPAGRYDTRGKLRELTLWRPSVLVGSASYLVRLADVAADMDLDLSACGVRALLTAGEPGAAIPANRALLRECFGPVRIVDRYGMTELPTLTRRGCPAHEGALHLNEDLVVVECLRPGSAEPVPPGESGELVFTNLVNDTQPLLRYRSGDVGRLSPRQRCECGSSLVRLERSVEGRVDDAIWYHGVSIFPSAVEAVVRQLPGLRSDYRIVLRGDPHWPELIVQVELAAPLSEEAAAAQRARVQAALHSSLQVRPGVEVLEPGGLAPVEGTGKTPRVLDRRDSRRAGGGP